MPLNILNINIYSVLPEIALAILAMAMMVVDFFAGREHKTILGTLSVIGLVIILPVAYMTVEAGQSFGGMVIADGFSAFFSVIFIIAAIFTIIISTAYLKKVDVTRGEYYYTVIFATLGMMVMAKSNDLINMYVGIELMALSFYILVAFRIDNSRSVEGALKYFVLGALSSGILLYGISFAYGFAGSTSLPEIAHRIAGTKGPLHDPFLMLSVAFIAVGLSFKVALFPFHIWAPDVYEGAPTPITAFLSVGSKAAAFAVFLRVFASAFPALKPQWSELLWGLSAATMVFGSIVAISQKNIVRMLAYSSIAHAGIILIGLIAFNSAGFSGVMYYLLVYVFMNVGAFTVVTLHIRDNGKGEDINDYKGLSQRRPLLSFLMALFLLSLAGIPPTGGFTAKFFILAAAVDAHYYWLAAIGVAATAISLFFYAKVIFYMYMKEPEADDEGLVGEAKASDFAYHVVLLLTAAGTMFIGVYPAPFMEMAVKAVRPLLM
ncbi:MAG: NADH-quinone oxidoreductase subunit N [Deltaproteobacteria bacterium]|nr:NADH-quinone oxidoreductase subunit N [Deltaproteobacteria bacterium]